MNWPLLLVLVCVCLGVAGELLFKTGAMGLRDVQLGSLEGAVSLVLSLLRNPVILLGFICYGTASILWIIVLSRLDLSYAFPLFALMYAIIPVAALIAFREVIPAGRWVGILFIVSGVLITLHVGTGAQAV